MMTSCFFLLYLHPLKFHACVMLLLIFISSTNTTFMSFITQYIIFHKYLFCVIVIHHGIKRMQFEHIDHLYI